MIFWFAGFIALACMVSDVCGSSGWGPCRASVAGAVFGAFEWWVSEFSFRSCFLVGIRGWRVVWGWLVGRIGGVRGVGEGQGKKQKGTRRGNTLLMRFPGYSSASRHSWLRTMRGAPGIRIMANMIQQLRSSLPIFKSHASSSSGWEHRAHLRTRKRVRPKW